MAVMLSDGTEALSSLPPFGKAGTSHAILLEGGYMKRRVDASKLIYFQFSNCTCFSHAESILLPQQGNLVRLAVLCVCGNTVPIFIPLPCLPYLGKG